MKLLADENQHPLVVARLRKAGYVVDSIAESCPGSQDRDILMRPDITEYVLLTYDRDFGDLIFNQGLPAPAAILYTRLSRIEPETIAARLLTLLQKGVPVGHMITITKNGKRVKPFADGAENG